MLEIHNIRENAIWCKEALRKRDAKGTYEDLIQQVIAKDDERRQTQHTLDERLAKVNKASKRIGALYREGKRNEAEKLKAEISAMKDPNKELEDKLHRLKKELNELLWQIPNVPHKSVPAGQDEEDNEVHKDWNGPLPELPENQLPHWELGEKYELFDLELGAKITGSGFILYRGKGAVLQRALISYFLSEATGHGYEEMIPPYLVNATTAFGTGQLPDKEGQMYHTEKDNLYLIPTAEVPLTNVYRDVILQEDELPLKLTGYTPCFRREAGSYGSHVKGLNRVHQFDKVEIVQIAHPEKSYQVLEEMVAQVERLLNNLNLPYRILNLCGGDLGFAAAKTYDFEVYSAAQERWLEVSSVSNFETYQSNRMMLRFRKSDSGRTELAHTLNGSALALPRILAAILENNQTKKGIVIPEPLVPYTGFNIIKKIRTNNG